MGKKTHNRIDIIDAVRGVCILLMVGYHLGYDLVAYGGLDRGLINNTILNFLQPFFAGVFIFVSGVCCWFSRNNLRRGAMMFAAGWVVTLVTWFMGAPAWFGILHFMGAAAMLFSVGHRLIVLARMLRFARKHAPKGSAVIGVIGSADGPTTVFGKGGASTFHGDDGPTAVYDNNPRRNLHRIIFVVVCFAAFFALQWWLGGTIFNVRGLWWLGFRQVGFYSSDYFPILPWIFVYLAGNCVGLWVLERRLPKWFYTVRVPFFAACGRYAMYIYLLHQPVLYGIVMAVKALVG